MALLKIFEPNLSGVRRELRSFYVADVEHGFRLDCDIDEVVRGLKSALQREREVNREFKAAGVTPDGLAVIGGMSKMATTRPPPDVRGGLLPRRNGTP